MLRLAHTLLILFISLSYAHSQAITTVGKDIIEKITSDKITIDKKLLICEKGFNVNDKLSADILIKYMQKCDRQLLARLANILAASNFCQKNPGYLNRIEDCLKKRVMEFKNDANAIFVIFETLENVEARPNGDTAKIKIQEKSKFLIKCLSELDNQNKNQLVDRLISGGMFLPIFFTHEEKCSLLLSECIESGDASSRNTILQFLLDFYFLINNRELVSEIAILTFSTNKIVRDKARRLMYELFPFACSDASKHTFEWNKWWKDNENNFPFSNQSHKILLDKKASSKSRLSILSKLSNLNPSIINSLLKISLDNSDDINVRSGCLAILISYVNQSIQKQSLNDSHANRILDSINNILNSTHKKDVEFMPRILNMLAGLSVINNNLNNTLCNLLISHNLENRIKSKVCIVLANSKTRKKLHATKCLEYYQGIRSDISPQLKEQVLYALMILTGQKGGYNSKSGEFVESLDFWQKAIDAMPDDTPEKKPDKEAEKAPETFVPSK